jgi:histidine kinase
MFIKPWAEAGDNSTIFAYIDLLLNLNLIKIIDLSIFMSEENLMPERGIDGISSTFELQNSMISLHGFAPEQTPDLKSLTESVQSLEKGLAKLNEYSWNTGACEALETHMKLAIFNHALGDFDNTEIYLNSVLSHLDSNELKAKVYNLKAILFHNLGRFTDAITCGVEGLLLLDFKIPGRPNKLHVLKELLVSKYRLRRLTINELFEVPDMTSVKAEIAMNLLVNIFSPAYFVDKNMLGLAIFKMLNISLKYGNMNVSSLAYVFNGLQESSIFGNYKSGHSFGQLAAGLNEKYGEDTYKCKTDLIRGSSLIPWKSHISEGIETLQNAMKYGHQTGDALFAGYATSILTEYSLLKGDNLDVLYSKCVGYVETLRRVKYEDNLHFYLVVMRMITKLRLVKPEFTLFELFCHEKNQFLFLKALENKGQHVPLTAYYIFKQQELYYNEKFKAAISVSGRSGKTVHLSNNLLHAAEHYFFYALSLLADYHNCNFVTKIKYKLLVKGHLRKLKKWASHCPENFQHKYLLVLAEIARINNRLAEACELYNHAKEAAAKNGFVQYEALSSELAGSLYWQHGVKITATNYLHDAYKYYSKWGATMKLNQISKKYPGIKFTSYNN